MRQNFIFEFNKKACVLEVGSGVIIIQTKTIKILVLSWHAMDRSKSFDEISMKNEKKFKTDLESPQNCWFCSGLEIPQFVFVWTLMGSFRLSKK